eukprot:CAMPEP_0201915674 /NCGR_PEP_ID=MMETSP0903-20130614/5531_1 /ASSEMBLY_ACC=CAM_ASM_000552 /TAXON_ID=420261 /ORGANISM="Thalassiosira antarctica, Strain CCMP982" /LENGTH=67 /DNA_ID=CAMNT_0048451335 /DNA_START=293 /DNA_END=496 /DNA_ORIENTATION=-
MATQFKEYSQGRVIVRQGDVGDAFYVIEKGCVDIFIREKSETHPVAALKPPCKYILGNGSRTAEQQE